MNSKYARGVLFMIIGLVVFLGIRTFINFFARYDSVSEMTIGLAEILLSTVPSFFGLLGLALIILGYLTSGATFLNSETRLPSMTIEQDKVINDRISKEINDKIDEVIKRVSDVENLKSFLSEQTTEKIYERIENRVDEKYKTIASDVALYERIDQELNSAELFISNHINKLYRNANVNLVIGTLTSIVAVGILGITSFEIDLKPDNYTIVLFKYVPRVSLSIFIEVFSFFFLRLYKNNLNDIKYFENERTNIKSKHTAVKIGFMSSQKEENMKLVINKLLETERNFKLTKDESTVFLEKFKIEKTSEDNLVQTLLGLINTDKK